MKTFPKCFASILMLLSGLAFLLGIFLIVAGNATQQVEGFTMTGTAIMSLLLSSAVWLLADITEALTAKLADSSFTTQHREE
jgi:multisubunit Na+/H+ antiporter MnhC subunit